MNAKFLNIQPSPLALVQSLRDIGYSMESAIADVIDNSITAEAENIYVRFAWNDGSPWLAVIDDGCGIAPAELKLKEQLFEISHVDFAERIK